MENPAEDHEIMMIPILLDFLSSLNATREKADNQLHARLDFHQAEEKLENTAKEAKDTDMKQWTKKIQDG